MFFKEKVNLLPPTTRLGQGSVFTRVCDSVHGGDFGLCPGVGRLCPRGVSDQGGVSVLGGGSLSQRGLCPEGVSVSWEGVSVQGGLGPGRGVSVQGGLCLGGSL